MSQQVFTSFPSTRPQTPLLDSVNVSSDLDRLEAKELVQLADELREFLLFTVGRTGGHFGAGLGVVELTIALHKVFNTPDDRIVWDVGHQTYPHKILTGRREAMANLRLQNGIAGFPKRSESEYDSFGVGHSSTSISAALGMALASQQKGEQRHAVAVIGDGAMTAGMAFEALHHAAHTKANMLVVLNDNQMSISANEGGLASYFAKIWASKAYTSVRERGKNFLSHLPEGAMELAKRTEEHMKGMVSPATLFEELGFNYIGPIDGHDLPGLLNTLGNVSELKGPQLIHVFTQKGHGFTPAVEEPTKYHAIAKIAPQTGVEKNQANAEAKKPSLPKYQDIFGQWLCDMAAVDKNLVGITPAMCEGSGMVAFSHQYPERYHDVAIAEQHAVTLAAGFACEGVKSVVAIYSTFLQRAYDQLIHDVAIQNLDVLFAIDRAGLVGEDGPTHAGNFDLSFLRCIPNMIIAAPSDENECRLLLNTAYHFKGPAAVRYPRGTGIGVQISDSLEAIEVGKARWLRKGTNIAILSFGVLLPQALTVAETLNATVLDMRFVKPIDAEAIDEVLKQHTLLVTLEDNVLMGGAGSAVNEYLQQQVKLVSVLNLALPDDFVNHGKRDDLLADCGLDAAGIEAAIQQRLQQLSAEL